MKWRYVSIPCCSDNWDNGERRREVKNPSATTGQVGSICKGGLTERISCWFLSKFSSVRVESRNTI